ncbi:hypothetical protein CN930_20100 [Bacillus cereus]|nr:hypothetical protein CN930_20100 [Bacillus cereus]
MNKNQKLYGHIGLTVVMSLLLFFSISNYAEGFRSVLLFIVGYTILSFIFILIKREISKRKNKENGQYPLPNTDERIEKLMLKISAQIFALALFIAFVVLFVMYFMNNNAVIKVEYVLGYVFLVLFIGVGFSSKIAKKMDQ